jgi:Ala-tRNA(Pro) deacylase
MAARLRQDYDKVKCISAVEEEIMSISRRIREYLDTNDVQYEWLPHPQAYTAQEVAHSLHLSGKRLAKTVVVDMDGSQVMAVLPASLRLSLSRFREATQAQRVEMMAESELARLFPDCDLGAIPPFGNLYGMNVWIDISLARSEEIVFTAGTHRDAIRMRYADFSALVYPQVGSFAEMVAAAA